MLLHHRADSGKGFGAAQLGPCDLFSGRAQTPNFPLGNIRQRGLGLKQGIGNRAGIHWGGVKRFGPVLDRQTSLNRVVSDALRDGSNCVGLCRLGILNRVTQPSPTLQGLQPAAERGDGVGVAVYEYCNILIVLIGAGDQVQQNLSVTLAGIGGMVEPGQGLGRKGKGGHN